MFDLCISSVGILNIILWIALIYTVVSLSIPSSCERKSDKMTVENIAGSDSDVHFNQRKSSSNRNHPRRVKSYSDNIKRENVVQGTKQFQNEKKILWGKDETKANSKSEVSYSIDDSLYKRLTIDYYIAHKILMDMNSAQAPPEVRWYQQKYKFRFLKQEDNLVFDCEKLQLIHYEPLDTAKRWSMRLSDYYLWKQMYYQRLVDYDNER